MIYIDAITQRQYTYADVRSTTLAFGQGLKSLFNWKKGDVVPLFTPNSIDTPAVTWGTHWAGGVICPANPGYTATELAHQLKDSAAKILLTQKALLPVAREAAKLAGLSEAMILLLGDERDPEGKFKHFTSIRNFGASDSTQKAPINPAKDLAFLVYSSGTPFHQPCPSKLSLDEQLTQTPLQAQLASLRALNCLTGTWLPASPSQWALKVTH